MACLVIGSTLVHLAAAGGGSKHASHPSHASVSLSAQIHVITGANAKRPLAVLLIVAAGCDKS